jgi:hypothetical protein
MPRLGAVQAFGSQGFFVMCAKAANGQINAKGLLGRADHLFLKKIAGSYYGALLNSNTF